MYISHCSNFRLQLTITGEEYIEDVIQLTVDDCTVRLNNHVPSAFLCSCMQGLVQKFFTGPITTPQISPCCVYCILGLLWFINYSYIIQEVSNVSPLSYCRGQRPDITLLGTELDANLDQHLATCRFSNLLLGLEFSMEEY